MNDYLGYTAVFLALIALIAVAIMVVRMKKNVGTEMPPIVFRVPENEIEAPDANLDDFLQFQSLELATIPDHQLVEVKDSGLVARLDATIMPAVQMAGKVLGPDLKNAFIAHIPKGTELAKSKFAPGMFRAIVRDGKKIVGQANLEKITVNQAAAVANVAANVMNVAALVVGQQFMAEISSKLDGIQGSLDGIGDRLDAALMGTIQAELAQISKISQFRVEIMESPEERNRQLISLEDHEKTISTALGQVNFLIAQEAKRFERRKGSKGVKAYQETVHRLNTLTKQQQMLLALLQEVGDLAYALGMGEKSIEATTKVFNIYLERSQRVRTNLAEWHSAQLSYLEIDLENDRAKKALFEGIPGLLNEKWRFVRTEEGLEQEIETQKQLSVEVSPAKRKSFDDDVKVVRKDGKYFYVDNGDEVAS